MVICSVAVDVFMGLLAITCVISEFNDCLGLCYVLYRCANDSSKASSTTVASFSEGSEFHVKFGAGVDSLVLSVH